MRKRIVFILISIVLLFRLVPFCVIASELATEQEAIIETSTFPETTAISETSDCTEITVASSEEVPQNDSDVSSHSLTWTSLTAIAAVLAPTVSAIMTVRSNERLKRLELQYPKAADAVENLIGLYSRQPRIFDLITDDPEEELRHRELVDSSFAEIKRRCYEVISLVPNKKIHRQILSFLDVMRMNLGYPNTEEEKAFQELIAAISIEISPYKSKPHAPRIGVNRKSCDTE